jgi:hypothetical protein
MTMRRYCCSHAWGVRADAVAPVSSQQNFYAFPFNSAGLQHFFGKICLRQLQLRASANLLPLRTARPHGSPHNVAKMTGCVCWDRFLDCNKITVGDRVLFGPNVQLYPPGMMICREHAHAVNTSTF